MTLQIKDLAISDSGFIFDPSSGETFAANHTAVELLRGLSAGLDDAALVEVLCQRYQVEPSEAQRDVADFLQLLATTRLAQPGRE